MKNPLKTSKSLRKVNKLLGNIDYPKIKPEDWDAGDSIHWFDDDETTVLINSKYQGYTIIIPSGVISTGPYLESAGEIAVALSHYSTYREAGDYLVL